MARARNIKPSLFKNEVLGVADPLLTILFVSLWCLADKAGRLEDRPLRIKAETFPYRDGIDVDKMLAELDTHGFIRRYTVNELRLIQVLNFSRHQSPHHSEKKSELPDYKGDTEIPVKAPLNTRPNSPDSLNTDSLNTEKAAAIAAVEDPVSKRIWKDGVDLLTSSGLKESSARPLLGRLAKDYTSELLAECIAATQAKNPADPKAFLIGALKQRSSPNPSAMVGKHDPANEEQAECRTCFDERELIHFPNPNSIEGMERRPCPDCVAVAV